MSDREFVLEREFRAPPTEVYSAYTDPALLSRWWTPTGGAFRVEALDVRPGGKWRFAQPMPNGAEITYSGEYLEVHPSRRLVYTFAIDGQDGSGVTTTVDLRAAGAGTLLTLTNRCSSKEAREAMVKYGAAIGAKMAWDRLEELLGGK